LNAFYGQRVTEFNILQELQSGNREVSLKEMADALPRFGFSGIGLLVTWEQLIKLKLPAIVHLKNPGGTHFSVVRGINAESVWTADPSLGNKTYSRSQFLAVWKTSKATADYGATGRVFLITPLTPDIQSSDTYFTKAPRRQTARIINQQIPATR